MIESPLKKGFYVTIQAAGFAGKFFKITGEEAFTYKTGDSDTAEFSTVAFGAETGFKNIEVMEPDDIPKRLFYVLWGVRDMAEYYLKIPSGTNRLGTDEDKDVGYINAMKSPYHSPNPQYAFWLIHDFYPSINCKNTVPTTITPVVWFCGYKYDIEEIKAVEILTKLRAKTIPCKEIVIGGVKVD